MSKWTRGVLENAIESKREMEEGPQAAPAHEYPSGFWWLFLRLITWFVIIAGLSTAIIAGLFIAAVVLRALSDAMLNEGMSAFIVIALFLTGLYLGEYSWNKAAAFLIKIIE